LIFDESADDYELTIPGRFGYDDVAEFEASRSASRKLQSDVDNAAAEEGQIGWL
jgi:hypothetical protein